MRVAPGSSRTARSACSSNSKPRPGCSAWTKCPASAPNAGAVGARDGRVALCRSSWLDEQGRLFIDCDIGFGLLHSLDTGIAARAVEAGDWQPAPLPFADMPQRFGYLLHPRELKAP